MGGSDMVLGVDWMKKFSPLTFDFNDLSMTFQKDGKTVTLKGGQFGCKLKVVSSIS